MDLREGEKPLQGGEADKKESSGANSPAVRPPARVKKKLAIISNSDKPANPMAALTPEQYGYKQVKYGDIVSGIVVRVAPHEILVDIGTKSEASVATKEVDEMSREGRERIHVGDEILAFVLRPEDYENGTILSLARAQEERDWRNAQAALEGGTILDAPVAGFNKGGLIVRVGKVRGFVPASQLEMAARSRGERELSEQDLSSFVGKKLKLKIIEIDRTRSRLILSERAAMREVRRDQRARLMEEIQEGELRTGTVTSIADFGVFVDLGGVDGLIHVSELSWTKIGHPGDAVKVGDTVEVKVLGIDREKNRIGLSLKRLQPEPWTTIEERYHIGQLVSATITKLASFGAFARVDEGIEGLIHVSELSDRRINHPKEVVKEGDVLQLRVIKIDPERRRLGLSLKRVEDEEYAENDQNGTGEWTDTEETAAEIPADPTAEDAARGAGPLRGARPEPTEQ
jgi:small subunit ribosomal protein S1